MKHQLCEETIPFFLGGGELVMLVATSHPLILARVLLEEASLNLLNMMSPLLFIKGTDLLRH